MSAGHHRRDHRPPRPAGARARPGAPVQETTRALYLVLGLGLLSPGCAGDDKPADEGEGQGAEDGAEDDGLPECVAAPLDCDGEDNDCDGETDEGGEVEARALWAQDEDGDGFPISPPRRACEAAGVVVRIDEARTAVDCDDRDPSVHPQAGERCLERGDEDCDGDADCADDDCSVDACVEVCDDGLDNDGDLRPDCHDPECYGALCPEDCVTEGDEDGDSLDGCLDTDCWGEACEENCYRAGDEDGDGLTECEDADCAETCIEACRDWRDNDRDGLEDCDDPDCTFSPLCWEDLELRTTGPIGLRERQRHTSSSPFLYNSTAWSGSVQIATATFVGRVPLDASSSALCTLRAKSFEIGSASVTWETSSAPTFRRSSAWATFGVLGPADPACPGAQLVDLLTLNWGLRRLTTRPALEGIGMGSGWASWRLEDRTWDAPVFDSLRVTDWVSGEIFGWRSWRETTWVGTATGLSARP
jgi:hypothetical protein